MPEHATRQALKEWAVVIEAMRLGRQIVLLRKGGIHEPHGEFKAAHEQFFLFPGFEHQRAEFLKPAEADRYAHILNSSGAGSTVKIETFAKLFEAVSLDDPSKAYRLAEHHIWSEAYVRQRVEYKPEKPLHVLLLRVYAMPSPAEVRRVDRYAGCKSWFELEEAISTERAEPVLGSAAFEERLLAVRNALR